MNTLADRLAFAHACTGEPLFREAAQELERKDKALKEIDEGAYDLAEIRAIAYEALDGQD